MQRFTISLEDKLADQFTAWIKRHGYDNRSEAVRDLVRGKLAEESMEQAQMPHCVASVVYVYDHHERELGRRLTHQQHQHHDLTVSTLHVHLDDSQCLEVTLLRGAGAEVTAQAQALIAERGVRNGKVHVVPAGPHKRLHSHD
jgi:CopG family transcriptional regulator, nickel-responsive regulator